MTARTASSTSHQSALRILVVDDVPEVRQELCRLLPLLAQVEVVGEAANGLDAVQLAAVLAPDTVVMDLEMPVLDGYEATRRIKQAQSECRIVALTIHGGAAERQKAALAGVDALVGKWESLDTLVQAILGGSLES
jgi:DNA-binding NarL/FixJ family response regulator